MYYIEDIPWGVMSQALVNPILFNAYPGSESAMLSIGSAAGYNSKKIFNKVQIMKVLRFKVKGTTALMLNNPQTVNPFNEYSRLLKPITSKRTKTEDDLMEISRIKFLSSLYVNNGVYVIPSQHFEQSVVNAAKERKLGKKIERSFRIFSDCPIDFKDKDKTPDQLYEIGSYVDIRAVGIKNVKITTTRAIIPEWSTTVDCYYDESQLDEKDIKELFDIAGQRYGVGTYRSLYGKFEIIK